MKKIIQTEFAPRPVGPYSQAINAGNFLFVSGQLAIDPQEGKIISGDIKAQTAQVMQNIKAILNAAGYDLSDIVHVTVYLSSMSLFSEFNSEYTKYFSKEPPARTTIGIELIPGALVEISVIAYKHKIKRYEKRLMKDKP
ncbi:MAG: Rid family detoxifying hydrolase [Candidatus Bathyarchaeota archaeon]|nr:Rid family detoxifying hydrolase [Candidatus Bathyarchaeota archaeon]